MMNGLQVTLDKQAQVSQIKTLYPSVYALVWSLHELLREIKNTFFY